jgi:hypothetical protein
MAHAHEYARKSRMKLRVDIAIENELLLVTAHGTLSFDASLHALQQVLNQARQKQVSRILIDAHAVDGALTTLERYDLAKQVATFIQQYQMNPRIALVRKPPVPDGIGARVSQNLGVTTEMFPARQEALNWLAACPNPPRTKSAGTSEN